MQQTEITYLSKSDFTLALDCLMKLYFKKMHYPTLTTEYIELLKQGGYMIGKIAQLLYDGSEIKFDEDLIKAYDLTMKALQVNENIFLYEATFFEEGYLVRVDILQKNSRGLKIIEVKSSSFDVTKYPPGSQKFLTKYEEKLNDIAFQYFVLKKIFPKTPLKASLMLPDKAKTVTLDNLPTLFTLRKGGNFYQVDFNGNKEELRKSNFLTEIDVTDVVIAMQDKISESAIKFLSYLTDSKGLLKFIPELSKNCRECEFRAVGSDDRDGFKECWGQLSNVDPHVFDLYYMGTIGGTKEPLVNKLISEKKVSMYDFPNSVLQKERGKRQKIQINYTRENKEWVSDELASIIKSVSYPLYFIDFEASTLVTPYHKGMRPYEKVAFQWSCHKIEKPGEEPTHFEWININNIFPNFDFAETLKSTIKNEGTVLTWATYENTTLKDIEEQMMKYNYKNKELSDWLNKIVKTKENPITRILDMNDLTLKHYFHPLMKGKTSLKWVLPAVWQIDDKLHHYEFSKKYYKEENGNIIDPYITLPKIDIAERAELVKEGIGAMMAYQEMLYGLSKDDKEKKEAWKKLLLQYCELDSSAMVIVWKHWENILVL